MPTRAKRRSWMLPLALSAPLLLAGCDVSLGPRVRDRIVFVRGGPAARVGEDKSVEVIVERDGEVYRDRQAIGGWYVLPPEAVENE